MNENTIRNNLQSIIKNMFSNIPLENDVLSSVDLIDDLGMDSITFISLLVELECTFSISIPSELLYVDYYRTIEDIVSIILELINNTESDLTDSI